jgi:Activator of Hsp90 ATPase homolog 1-like protein
MQNQNFTATLLVDQTPEEVFAAINNIRGWWSEDIEGSTDKLDHEFMYRDKHLWAKMKITELIPGKKVVWHVLESQMDDVEDGTEWNDTKLIFEITKKDDKTKIQFTHLGLVPEFDCYTVCSKAWEFYIKSSLQRLITRGQGEPIKKE